MSMEITCPNGHQLVIRDEQLGRRVRCPACKAEVEARPPTPAEPQLASRQKPPAVTPAPSVAPREEVVDYDPANDPANEPAHEPSDRPWKRKEHQRSRKRRAGESGRLRLCLILGGSGVVAIVSSLLLWFLVLGPLFEGFGFPSEEPITNPRTGANHFSRQIELWRQKYGEKRVVFVCVKGLPQEMTPTVLQRFRDYGFQSEQIAGGRFGSREYPDLINYTWVVLAPTDDLDELAKKIDLGRVASIRVSWINVVADLSKFEGVLPEMADPVTRLLSLAKAKSNERHTRERALIELQELRIDRRRAEVARNLENLLDDAPSLLSTIAIRHAVGTQFPGTAPCPLSTSESTAAQAPRRRPHAECDYGWDWLFDWPRGNAGNLPRQRAEQGRRVWRRVDCGVCLRRHPPACGRVLSCARNFGGALGVRLRRAAVPDEEEVEEEERASRGRAAPSAGDCRGR